MSTPRSKQSVCKKCGSDDVRWDAWAIWNPHLEQMELHSTYDNTWCESCESDCTVVKGDEYDILNRKFNKK